MSQRAFETVRFYRTRELADKLGVHFRTVERWRRLGKITPSVVLPGGPRYTDADIQAFLDAQTPQE